MAGEFDAVLRSECDPEERSDDTTDFLNCMLHGGLLKLSLSDIHTSKYALQGGHRNSFSGAGFVMAVHRPADIWCDCCSFQICLRLSRQVLSLAQTALKDYATNAVTLGWSQECVRCRRLALYHE